jgi:hypothetical protein
MLDAHSELAIPAETHFLVRLERRFRRHSKQSFLAVITSDETWPNLGLDKEALRDELDRLEPFTVSAGVRCLYGLYAGRMGKDRWGDKTPPYRRHLRRIERLLPEAHFIHVIRDGRDVAVSLRGLWWGPGYDVEAQAQFWAEEIRRTRQESRRVRHYAEVRYEELVGAPESTLRTVCDYVALRFEPGMLTYHETAASRMAEYVQPFGPAGRPEDVKSFISIHERVIRSPDPTRVGRWRTAMTDDERRRYEAVAGPLLRELGYQTEVS